LWKPDGLHFQGQTKCHFKPISTTLKQRPERAPADFKRLAAAKGFTEQGTLRAGVKTREIVALLKGSKGDTST
jgi:hypothetical protein